ncbi:MAG: phosphoribosylglycinamide formyltransferase [Alphaproteobacteria bacterium]|jgi:phosphoribosylglycinamide formyltransferase 1|nr:phosphoribosylglycinamide formyltransferase [Alphaproteobacteria bacterium]MBT4083869.1 phosphoribosylglycinamide formyltransferase [Alphaproteobacteria bacterium]MBT4546171.1 phosphoribosylglycinamide formyltransferase [Alphaproteobacteria bacterium]MBT7747595.1 phosphoribosylglycinamide formyltransferase [Alphaproteobacteria bacterium]
MLKVAVLVSGRGSNLQALIDVCAKDDFPAEIVTVISNVPDVFALERAAKAGIATSVVNHKNYPDRQSFETELQVAIGDSGAELVCLAGFMRILTDGFVNQWRDRLVNIHPSLLPSFKGVHVHEQALEAGVKVSGCTVHFVVPDLDSGPIIAQETVPVLQDDDADALAARILEAEHRCYPEALRLIAEGRVVVTGNKTVIQTALA